MKFETLRIIHGHCLDELAKLPDESVQCCVTSPPYFGLRDYKLPPVTWPDGWVGQHGLEPAFDLFVEHEVLIFREVRRVLRGDGVMWLNLGDSYATGAGKVSECPGGGFQGEQFKAHFGKRTPGQSPAMDSLTQPNRMPQPGLKPKDLCGIPWRVAFALQADGWYLRCDVIWQKPNPMPESVTDRPTKSHEYIFLFSKNESCFYDHEAIKDPVTGGSHPRANGKNSRMVKSQQVGRELSMPNHSRSHIPGVNPKATLEDQHRRIGQQRDPRHADYPKSKQNGSFSGAVTQPVANRNKRSVWTVATSPFKGAHFATFPPALITPCILAGTSAKGCCAKCGAPLERIVEKEKFGKEDYNGKNLDCPKNSAGRNILAHVKVARANGNDHDNPFPPAKTIGWKATCECQCAEVVPCTVLDPFGGSLTSAQVALDNGRACVIIELNPEYVQMGKDRIGLFQTAATKL